MSKKQQNARLKASDILDMLENGNISDLEVLSDVDDNEDEHSTNVNVENGINFGDETFKEIWNEDVDGQIDFAAEQQPDDPVMCFASNFVGIGETDEVKRWEKKDKAYTKVACPQVTKEYNSAMGGVDLFNRYIALYRITVRSKKWTLRVVFHAIDMAVTNSWLEYKRTADLLKVPTKEQLDLLAFRLQLAEELIKVGKPVSGKKRGRPSTTGNDNTENVPLKKTKHEQRPLQSVQNDKVDHLPIHDGKPEPTRCKNKTCGKFRSHFFFSKSAKCICASTKKETASLSFTQESK